MIIKDNPNPVDPAQSPKKKPGKKNKPADLPSVNNNTPSETRSTYTAPTVKPSNKGARGPRVRRRNLPASERRAMPHVRRAGNRASTDLVTTHVNTPDDGYSAMDFLRQGDVAGFLGRTLENTIGAGDELLDLVGETGLKVLKGGGNILEDLLGPNGLVQGTMSGTISPTEVPGAMWEGLKNRYDEYSTMGPGFVAENDPLGFGLDVAGVAALPALPGKIANVLDKAPYAWYQMHPSAYTVNDVGMTLRLAGDSAAAQRAAIAARYLNDVLNGIPSAMGRGLGRLGAEEAGTFRLPFGRKAADAGEAANVISMPARSAEAAKYAPDRPTLADVIDISTGRPPIGGGTPYFDGAQWHVDPQPLSWVDDLDAMSAWEASGGTPMAEVLNDILRNGISRGLEDAKLSRWEYFLSQHPAIARIIREERGALGPVGEAMEAGHVPTVHEIGNSTGSGVSGARWMRGGFDEPWPGHDIWAADSTFGTRPYQVTGYDPGEFTSFRMVGKGDSAGQAGAEYIMNRILSQTGAENMGLRFPGVSPTDDMPRWWSNDPWANTEPGVLMEDAGLMAEDLHFNNWVHAMENPNSTQNLRAMYLSDQVLGNMDRGLGSGGNMMWDPVNGDIIAIDYGISNPAEFSQSAKYYNEPANYIRMGEDLTSTMQLRPRELEWLQGLAGNEQKLMRILNDAEAESPFQIETSILDQVFDSARMAEDIALNAERILNRDTLMPRLAWERAMASGAADLWRHNISLEQWMSPIQRQAAGQLMQPGGIKGYPGGQYVPSGLSDSQRIALIDELLNGPFVNPNYTPGTGFIQDPLPSVIEQLLSDVPGKGNWSRSGSPSSPPLPKSVIDELTQILGGSS